MTGFSGTSYSAGTRAPAWPFALSMTMVAMSIGLIFFTGSKASPLLINLIGWFSGAVLPVLFLVIYQHRERHLRGRGDFVTTAHGKRRIIGATVLGLTAGAFHGYDIAGWLAS